MPAWQYVGVSSVATSSSGDIVLTEPAGVQEGDLLVAIISYRSNAAFTNPGAPWADVTQQNTGNTTVNTTGSIGSGKMSYCIRGSGAPGLTFTRTAGDVALGRIVAYRNVEATGTLVTSGSTTLAAAATAISVTGVTTSNARDLIVVGACGARNSSFTNFDAATDPTTTSGTASGETGNPAEGDWQERADSGTTTGADCSLGIADALRATAGVTGNITITASSSARHVVLIGVFKESTVSALTANDVESASSLTKPALGQIHALFPASAPDETGYTMGRVDEVSATMDGLTYPWDSTFWTGAGTGARTTLSKPAIAIVTALTANDIESTSSVNVPALTQVHVLNAAGVQSASELTKPAITQVHNILANDVQSASGVSIPALTQVHVILANDVESASSVSVPVMAQVHALLANDVQSASSVSIPVVGQIHALTANDVESASELTKPALAENAAGTDVLLAEDVESATELSKPVLAVVSAPVEAPPISGPSYSPNAKAAMEVYRLLFGKKEAPSKKRRRVKRLEDAALKLLNDFRPEEYQPIDLTALNLALKSLNKKFVPKPDAKRSEKLQIIQTLIEEAERLRREIDEDDEEILLMLAA